MDEATPDSQILNKETAMRRAEEEISRYSSLEDEASKSRIGDMEFTDEELKRFVEKRVSAYSSFPGESKPQPKQNGYGVSVAMLLWSACIFAFAVFSPFPVWVHGCAEVLGLLALLIGILGTCIEVFKGKQ
jgi:hypothetical protein